MGSHSAAQNISFFPSVDIGIDISVHACDFARESVKSDGSRHDGAGVCVSRPGERKTRKGHKGLSSRGS